jgi:hypothetical protein
VITNCDPRFAPNIVDDAHASNLGLGMGEPRLVEENGILTLLLTRFLRGTGWGIT